jgi:O-acetylhomoserine/O-acetylserine sulfhydrylase-like pyridoxal-dependent enzyme
MRSMETLSLRIERAAENAATVAKFLRTQPKVAAVNYLGFLPRQIHAPTYSSASAKVPVLRLELSHCLIRTVTGRPCDHDAFKTAEAP